MKKSTREWLDRLYEDSNSKAIEIRDYIVKLEEENAKLKAPKITNRREPKQYGQSVLFW